MANMRYVLRWLFSLVSCILCCGCCCNREEEHHHGHHRVGESTFKSTKEQNYMKLIWTPPKSQWWDCQSICLIDVITYMNDPALIFKYGSLCPGATKIGKISFTFPRIWQSFSNTWGKWECLHIEICTLCRCVDWKSNHHLSCLQDHHGHHGERQVLVVVQPRD